MNTAGGEIMVDTWESNLGLAARAGSSPLDSEYPAPNFNIGLARIAPPASVRA
jgi:hypothetical protein